MALESKVALPPPRLGPPKPATPDVAKGLRAKYRLKGPPQTGHHAPAAARQQHVPALHLHTTDRIQGARLLEARRVWAARQAKHARSGTLGAVFDGLEEAPLSVLGAAYLSGDPEREPSR